MFNVEFVEAEHMKHLIKILKINLLTGLIITANTNMDSGFLGYDIGSDGLGKFSNNSHKSSISNFLYIWSEKDPS